MISHSAWLDRLIDTGRPVDSECWSVSTCHTNMMLHIGQYFGLGFLNAGDYSDYESGNGVGRGYCSEGWPFDGSGLGSGYGTLDGQGYAQLRSSTASFEARVSVITRYGELKHDDQQ